MSLVTTIALASSCCPFESMLRVPHLPACLSNVFFWLWNASVGATQSFPSPLIEEESTFILHGPWGEEAGPSAGQPRAHTDIISCLSVQQYRLFPDHKCQCPAGQLWSWPPTALQPPQGHIQVKAITSLRLKLLNLPQGPQMLSVSLWPLTCPT